eukprot:CAMPEP_0194346240 /NCGR_PEP_ID=MMETSP0171-20130528/105313_1 /TAXON_ID=218684 /ORGANISM="Corethron pennatum, Strain L29A3" /LENGTH=113 /DNA_ID=CAMNT_0039113337 /DNA_START=667 /DNA_END=1009 /DNA_ORIENTATION=+
MSGPLPKEMYSLKNLDVLDINDNNFVGTISHDIENMKSLELVSLYNNNFEGKIPWTSASILKRVLSVSIPILQKCRVFSILYFLHVPIVTANILFLSFLPSLSASSKIFSTWT